MNHVDPWFAEDDHRHIEIATSFPVLVDVAVRVIARNRKPPMPIVQVCGPMTSGGGKLEENTAKIARAIAVLRERGLTVFSQAPFRRGMLNFTTIEDYQKNPLDLLDGFYGSLFRGRHIQALTFLTGWEKSFGCQWEYETGKALGMEISFLPDRCPLWAD